MDEVIKTIKALSIAHKGRFFIEAEIWDQGEEGVKIIVARSIRVTPQDDNTE